MHILHYQIDQDRELQNAVTLLSQRIKENRLKHGLILDLNPFWLAAYSFWNVGYDPKNLYRFTSNWPWFPFPEIPPLVNIPDFGKNFEIVDDLTHNAFGRKTAFQPYLLRIYAHPILTPDAPMRQQHEALLSAAREAPIPTLVESRRPPSLLASAGDRILSAAGDKGTLGGFLKDNATGKVYGVTCGHVVSSGTVISPSGALGTCAHAAPPQKLPVGAVCCTGCAHMTDNDLALVDMGNTPFINRAKTIAKFVSNRQIVEMDGATSGRVHYEIGGAVVEQEIDGYCWTRLYQVHASVSAGLLPVSLRVATTPLPKNGDSGAWLLRGTTDWAGMIVASDALHGYAVPATMVHAGAEGLINARLSLA